MSNRIETNRTNDGFSVVAAGVDIEKTLGTAAYREATTVIAEGKASLPTAGAVADYVATHASSSAELLWEGNFNGAGNIDAPGLGDYLLIGIVSKSGMFSVGSTFNGGLNIGQADGNNLTMIGYRFTTSSEYPDRLTVDSHNRGLSFNVSSTYAHNNNDVTISKIYGLVKKPATN